MAGTVAGYSENDDDNDHKGVAYMAKLAFVDLGEAGSPTNMWIPTDFGSDLFEHPFNAGR